MSSISYPTFFPQLPQNAIPAFNGVPHSEQKRDFTLSSAGAGADSLSASGSDAGSATVTVPGVDYHTVARTLVGVLTSVVECVTQTTLQPGGRNENLLS